MERARAQNDRLQESEAESSKHENAGNSSFAVQNDWFVS